MIQLLQSQRSSNVSPDTIRLSNGLTGNALEEDQILLISPIDGIIYKVKEGDTPQAIADKYFAKLDSLLAFNDAEETKSFKAGERDCHS